mgnify:FL=1
MANMLPLLLDRIHRRIYQMNITDQAKIQLSPNWLKALEGEFSKPYWHTLSQYLMEQEQGGKTIYPPGEQLFSAFNHTDLENVRVVIIGQDPYHGLDQANGLCFSVAPGNKIPPSLRNIFSEIESDLHISAANHGCLKAWAEQGVFLLNTVLSVEESDPGAHAGQGWESFTDTVIALISQQCESVVFMLWGSHAQKKAALVDASHHQVLCAPHPSPLSAYRGFFGCRHFSVANSYLQSKNRQTVDWRLPPMMDDHPQITFEL